MKLPWLDSLPPRKRRWLLWSVGLVLFYTVFGFLILPLIVRSVAVKQLSRQLGRDVSIAKVKINPYAMSATIRGFLIQDLDGKPFVSWDEVYANFQFLSIFTKTFVFHEISTSHPYVRVQVNPDYSLNFSDIIEKIAKQAAAAPRSHRPSKPLALRIDQLKISAARLSATDLTTRKPFTKIVGPLELTLQNFATNPDNRNPYSFTGSTEEGERFSWSGHFFLDPVRSVGDFSLENLSLAKYAPLYQDFVRFDIRDGTVDVRASYDIQQGKPTHVARLTNTSVVVRSLKIAEPGAESNAMEVPEFSIAGVSADAFGRIAEVRSISTSGGRIALRRNADASVNLIELAKPNPDATNAAGSVQVLLQSLTNVVQLLLRSTNSWIGAVHEFNVTNYSVRLEDLANARPVRLDLDQIEVSVRNVSNLPGSNITAAVALRWNTNGTIRSQTSLSLFPAAASVQFALNNVEIRALDPYLDPFLNLLVTRGTVGMNGNLRLALTSNALPDMSFQGDVRVDDFATVDGVMTEDFLQCRALRVSGIDATLEPFAVAIRQIALQDASARLVIGGEKSNNLFAVLRKDMTGSNAPAASPKPAPKKTRKRAPMIAMPTNLLASAQGLPKISIGAIVFTNAHLDYVDRSLKPGVALSVDQVAGSIAGLSTEDLSRANVKLTGLVGGTAPMEISGQINPLSKKEFSDVKVIFHGIELIPTSPYSGRFLGYRLNKGKLSLDLHYRLAEGKLKGQNLVTVDQLMLGDRVESPDATSLPVKLGIAILKDRSGKIELDVPVEGTLGDPEFRLGKVITRALLNVLTKIVTSPFSALGAVFGGKGEEISYQDFAPGQAALLPTNREKLDTLVQGLFDRPGLQLEIEGSVDADADRAALRQSKLRQEWRMKKWLSLRKSERSRLTPEQIEFSEEDYAGYIKESHAAAFSPAAVAARGITAGTNAPPAPGNAVPIRGQIPMTTDNTQKGAAALLKDSRKSAPIIPAQDMESQLMSLIEVTAGDLALLGQQRAQQVQQYILQTGKVEAERLFLAENSHPEQTTKGSRVYLHLR